MPRILFVTPGSPYPPTFGGNQRTNLVHRALSRVADVDLLLVQAKESISAEDERMLREKFGLVSKAWPVERAKLGGWRYLRPLNPGIVDRVAHHLGNKGRDYGPNPGLTGPIQSQIDRGGYDLIVGRYLLPSFRADLVKYAPVVLDVDDVDLEVYMSRIKDPSTPWLLRSILRRHLGQLKRLLPEKLAKTEALWVCKESDRLFPGLEKAVVLPNIPWTPNGALPAVPLASERSDTILFVGSYAHLPNVLGIDRFLQRDWPQIHATEPRSRFRLAGGGLSAERKAKWASVPGVEIAGWIENLADAYGACAFTVAPIFTGGGTNIKIIESLAYGRTSVVSPHAYRGYEGSLHHRESLWLADESLVAGCLELLRNEPLRTGMAAKGRAVAEAKYSFDAFTEIVTRTVSPFLGRGKVRRR